MLQDRRIKLWDLPTRLTHWLLVTLVATAFATGLTGGDVIEWHGQIGLGILGLLVFRLIWGFIGSTYARFSQFVRGPQAIKDYLKGDWRGLGHNPLGAISVLALLGLLGLQVATGLFANDDIIFEGPLADLVSSDMSETLTGIHRQSVWLLGGLICLHILAALFYTLARKNNLITPMLSGYKSVIDPQARSARGGGAIPFILAFALACGAVWVAAGGPFAPPSQPAATTPEG